MLALTDCQLRILAVGGGGQGGIYHPNSYYGGGGGSGEVKLAISDISPSFDKLDVYVGDKMQPSSLKYDSGANITVAGPGSEAISPYTGGSGYCGGGSGNGAYKGGSDGGNGAGSYQGTGSGLKIKTFLLNNFKITPGDGGYHSRGGVIVDGNDYPASASSGQGIGYGGGGEGAYDSANLRDGHEGIVLLEIMKKKP